MLQFVISCSFDSAFWKFSLVDKSFYVLTFIHLLCFLFSFVFIFNGSSLVGVYINANQTLQNKRRKG